MNLETIQKEGFLSFCKTNHLTESIYAHVAGRIKHVEYEKDGCLLIVQVKDFSIRCFYPAEHGNVPMFYKNDFVEIVGTILTHLGVYSLSSITILDVAPCFEHISFTKVYAGNVTLKYCNLGFAAELNLPDKSLSSQHTTIYCKTSDLTKEMVADYVYGHLHKVQNRHSDLILALDEVEMLSGRF